MICSTLTNLHYNRSIYSHYKKLHYKRSISFHYKIDTMKDPSLYNINLHCETSTSYNAKHFYLITWKRLQILQMFAADFTPSHLFTVIP